MVEDVVLFSFETRVVVPGGVTCFRGVECTCCWCFGEEAREGDDVTTGFGGLGEFPSEWRANDFFFDFLGNGVTGAEVHVLWCLGDLVLLDLPP